MAKEKKDLRAELVSYKYDFDILQKIPCTRDENKAYEKLVKEGKPLPKDIYPFGNVPGTQSNTEFYKLYQTDLTEAEITEYLTYKQLSILTTIKNCVLFFTILTIISLVVALIIATR